MNFQPYECDNQVTKLSTDYAVFSFRNAVCKIRYQRKWQPEWEVKISGEPSATSLSELSIFDETCRSHLRDAGLRISINEREAFHTFSHGCRGGAVAPILRPPKLSVLDETLIDLALRLISEIGKLIRIWKSGLHRGSGAQSVGNLNLAEPEYPQGQRACYYPLPLGAG